MNINDIITDSQHKCPYCGGPVFEYSELGEGKKDACYYKVKASAKVWPSAYASGRLVQCRKKGAANYGNKSESVSEGVAETVSMDQAKKVLRHYGADHFKTTTNELHFYKNGRPMSVDLIFNDDATRSVSLSQLNSATRRLKGQGVAEGLEESYMIIRTDAEGKKDMFAKFSTYEKAQKELDGLLDHPLHTKYKQKFEIKRKGGEQGVAEGSDMLSLDDKIKMYANHKSKTQHAENRGDYTTADKHKKQASRIYSNIVNLHFGDDGKDAQNAANEYIRKSQAVAENFADGRNPQDKGDAKRHGVPTKASVSTLRKVAKQGGRKGQLAHWMANMKAGRAKNEDVTKDSDPQLLFYAKLPEGTKVYARIKDAEQLADLQQQYRGAEIKTFDFRRPDVQKWLEARRINLRKFTLGMVQTMYDVMEAAHTANFNDDDWYEINPDTKTIVSQRGPQAYQVPFGQRQINLPNGNIVVRGMRAKGMGLDTGLDKPQQKEDGTWGAL